MKKKILIHVVKSKHSHVKRMKKKFSITGPIRT